MLTIKKNILHITPFFSPNIGGVETYLEDLVKQLDKLGYGNYIQTYSPLTTSTPWKSSEKIGKNIHIKRYCWYGHNLFYQLEKHPLINFLYITPYLLIRTFLWLLFNHQKIDIIHTHGLNAALIGVVSKRIFKIKKHIVSIYSSYDNVAPGPLTIWLMTYILNQTDKVLTQSQLSITQLKKYGINPKKLGLYQHWIDLNKFKPFDKLQTRKKLNIENKFTVLFVGRMIPQKGALLLAKVAKLLSKINFIFVGTGADYTKLKNISIKYKNIKTIGDVPYNQLNSYYNIADVFCIPSLYAEGWGRVIMESLACGVPVIASNKGAIPEVIDSTISIIIKPTINNLKKSIFKLFKNPHLLTQMKDKTRNYSLKHFSSKNINYITKNY